MIRKRDRRGSSFTTFGAGLIALIVVVVFTYLGFTKFANPFASHYTVDVMFANANGLQKASLVRVAGVNVGKVKSVQPAASCKSASQSAPQCNLADVTLQFQDQGLPLHKDATFWIRPRIFLEGNFFVDVNPGTPEAPVAPSGWVFSADHGREPVQFDQVLTSLQADTRRNLQILLQQYGIAVQQGGPAYNRSIQYWLPAYKYSAIVAHDMLGLRPHDLSTFIYKQGDISAALDAHPPNLKSFITDFNTTAGALAKASAQLAQAVRDLPRLFDAATPAFTALNGALCAPGPRIVPNCAPGPLRILAKGLTKATQSTPNMVDASLPLIHQLRLLIRPQELGGLVSDLSQTIPALTQLTKQTIPFLQNQVRPLSSCVVNVTYPWSQSTLHDPHFNAANGFPPRKVYIEAADFLPGLAGESRNFDANSPYIRVLLALGNTAVTSLSSGLIGGLTAPIVGEQPQPPPGFQHPPFKPNVPCETQPAVTNFDTGSGAAPPQPGGGLTGTIPSNILSQLGLTPPHIISSDNSGGAKPKSAVTAALTPAELAAARQLLIKYGLWEMVPRSLVPPALQSLFSGATATGGDSNTASNGGSGTTSSAGGAPASARASSGSAGASSGSAGATPAPATVSKP